MKLTRIAGECPDEITCPTVYETDRGTIVVQGYVIDPDDLKQISLPDGESAVEIPLSLLQKVADAHTR